MMPRGTSVLPALLIVPSLSLLVAYIWARATRPALPGWDRSGAAMERYSFAGAGGADEVSGLVGIEGGGEGGGGDLGRYMGFQDDATSSRLPSWYVALETPYDYKPPSRLAASGLGDGSRKLRVLIDADLPSDSDLVPYILSLASALRKSDTVDIYNVPLIDPSVGDEEGAAGEDVEKLREAREERKWLGRCSEYDLIWRIEDPKARSSDTSEGVEQGAKRKRRRCGDVPILSDAVQSGPYGAGKADNTASINLLHNPDQLLSSNTNYTSLKQLHGDEWEMGLFAHVLPSADPAIYRPKRSPSRRTVTYFPSRAYLSLSRAERPVLPYDARWDIHVPRNIPDKLLKRVASGRGREWNDVGGRSEVREWVMREEERRAGRMRRSGLCLFDTWQDGLTSEMAQAMLSGCVVVGVIPDVKREHFKDLVLPLSPFAQFNETNPAIPIRQIEHILHNTRTATLDRMALRAFVFARRELVIQRKVEDVRGLLDIWRRGGRGYQFTSGFRWTCSTPVGPGGDRPPWCSD